ncbi:hypothetical protein [Rhizobium ruizarguesonis]|uniref:hypothetical protein n=1 Tax=Rhizobium ruizarguesonis TaxID=2081791 RepID=UPI001030FCFA|nr:hypothetical protein [Rhizobium ruizarguesonis]TAY79694.1 hypothetical protein ELH86_12420 [Rhizobium ruizarguesonis]TBD21805.1 hypothetical protein ELH23_13405 [Rhizobium ruizarguesonis]
MALGFEHPNVSEPKALAIPVQPQPGEGLADVVFRACAENGFHDLWIINRLLGKQSIKQGWGHSRFARSDFDVEVLAHFLGVPNGVADIERLMYRKGTHGVNFFGVEISGIELMAARRISPLSLRERPYAKAIWSIRSLSFDPRTKERLLDRCPECSSVLQYRIAGDIFRCTRCGVADFRDHPQPIVEVEDAGGLDFVTDLIDPEAKTNSTVHDDLKNFGKGEIFTLATTLARVIQTENSGGNRRPSPMAESLSLAGSAIKGWPKKFAEIVETYTSSKNPDQNHTLDSSLYGVTAELRKVVRKELATVLSGRTRNYDVKSQARRAATHVKFWSSPAIMDQANKFGLPVIDVLALYANRVIECPDRRYAERLGISGGAPPMDFGAFESHDAPISGFVSVLDAVWGSKSTRHPWTQVMGEIIRNSIGVSIRASFSKNFIKSAYTADVERIRFICGTQDSTVDPKATVNVREAKFYLRLGPGDIARLKRQGYFKHDNITMEEIWQFQEQFISPFEIRSRLTVAGIKAPSFIQIGLGLQAAAAKRTLLDLHRYHRDDGEQYLFSIIGKVQADGQSESNNFSEEEQFEALR